MSETDVTTKICFQCGVEKPTYEFHKHSREKDGFRRNCKQCRADNGECRYIKPAPPDQKWCRSCNTLYSATTENFYWDSTNNRLYAACKSCHDHRTRNWQKQNHDYWIGLNHQWMITHPDKMKLARKNWGKNYPEKLRAARSKGSAKRRARVANAVGTHTAADILLQIASQTDKKGHLRCWWCGDTIDGAYHVDHRTSLARGGTDWPNNLVVSCAKCNLSKNDKTPQEWAGRLL